VLQVSLDPHLPLKLWQHVPDVERILLHDLQRYWIASAPVAEPSDNSKRTFAQQLGVCLEFCRKLWWKLQRCFREAYRRQRWNFGFGIRALCCLRVVLLLRLLLLLLLLCISLLYFHWHRCRAMSVPAARGALQHWTPRGGLLAEDCPLGCLWAWHGMHSGSLW